MESNNSPYSVLDLVADSDTGAGRFEIRLDQERIKILLSPRDQVAMDVYRSKGTHSPEFVSLFSGVYLHAVTEAIRALPEHATKKWQKTMRRSLDKHGVTVGDELLKQHASRHAQTIMGNPLGHLLTVFAKRDDED